MYVVIFGIFEFGRLNSSKAAGLNELHPMLLNLLREQLAPPLMSTYNQSLENGELSHKWKEAVLCQYVSSVIRTTLNYRPISLTSLPCKVMERILRQRVCEFFLESGFVTRSNMDSSLVAYVSLTSASSAMR